MKVTGQSVMQLCFVRDPVQRMQRYTALRWNRSVSGPAGPYSPATAAAAAPAELVSAPTQPDLAGTALRLRVNAAPPRDVSFEANASAGEAAAIIQEAFPELVASAQAGTLVLRTVAAGSTASIEVLTPAGPTAASLLGLVGGEVAVGLDADVPLDAETTLYGYLDQQADPSFYYAVELVNTVTGQRERVGEPRPGRGINALSPDKLVGAYVSLCDMSGAPLVGRRIFLYNALLPNRIADGDLLWGVFRQSMEAAVDSTGFAEFVLVRGVEIDVTIAGTGFTRRVRIPDDGGPVDLLDANLDVRDEFGIQKSPIDYAIRTTL